MATYGIVIGIPHHTLTLLANIEMDYGREFRSAMHAIRKNYTYNHVHYATSLQTILLELAGADGVRALKDAPAPNSGTAHSVANSVSFLNSLMNGDSKSDYTESAYGASSNSSSSKEQRKSHDRNHRIAKKPKSCKKKKKKRTRMKSHRRTHAPIARNTTAGRHIASNQTNARGTRNTRDTASSQSVMSSK